MASNLSSGMLGSLATSIKKPSTSLPTLTSASGDTGAADDDRRAAPSNPTLSADRERRCPPERAGLSSSSSGLTASATGGGGAAAWRRANSSRMAATASTSYSVSDTHDSDGIRRSPTVASSSCHATLRTSSNLDVADALRMFAALRSLRRKLQETASLSAGIRLTIFSRRRRCLVAICLTLALPPSPPLPTPSNGWSAPTTIPSLATLGSHRRAYALSASPTVFSWTAPVALTATMMRQNRSTPSSATSCAHHGDADEECAGRAAGLAMSAATASTHREVRPMSSQSGAQWRVELSTASASFHRRRRQEARNASSLAARLPRSAASDMPRCAAAQRSGTRFRALTVTVMP
ncbi:hypothetical protein EE612_012170 [Oryza sativa]|nr:hypothetical protein EE612_012170 [Oryza sativa]